MKIKKIDSKQSVFLEIVKQNKFSQEEIIAEFSRRTGSTISKRTFAYYIENLRKNSINIVNLRGSYEIWEVDNRTQSLNLQIRELEREIKKFKEKLSKLQKEIG